MYATIRDVIGQFIGKKILDITQHDADEWEETKQAYVMLMFDDGNYLKFYVDDSGFVWSDDDD